MGQFSKPPPQHRAAPRDGSAKGLFIALNRMFEAAGDCAALREFRNEPAEYRGRKQRRSPPSRGTPATSYP